MSLPLVLLLNLTITSLLTGLIWTIQWVHYPGFGLINPADCAAYQARHMRRITYLVGPLMLAELLISSYLLFQSFALPELALLNKLAAACVVLLWAITAGVFVPLHKKLTEAGYTTGLVKKLVRRNWWRTTLWTLRLLLVFTLLLFYL